MIRANKLKGISRSSGVLLHITSLPSNHGIGDLGPAAHAWVDLLARNKQRWWQILPLNPTGEGNSPYCSFSAFAGNPLLVSPELLVRDGLLGSADIVSISKGSDFVDYERVYSHKTTLFDRAWRNFKSKRGSISQEFARYRKKESLWLDYFALYMALREKFSGTPWANWPKALARCEPAALAQAKKELAEEVERHQFFQFLFHRQCSELRKYAAQKQVGLIGDLPIFVAGESADVWANPGLFLLDRNGQAKMVAGVPPDYFSEIGQRWGNPLYDWRAMERDEFSWWVDRFKAVLTQVDVVRIDHFRGFAACWNIPEQAPDARSGRWVKAPGKALFEKVRKELGSLPFIAEDLGVITPDVAALRDSLGLPGMRVLQFAFGGDSNNPFLPHNYERNTVAYTGTHDNNTTVGWFISLSPAEQDRVTEYSGEARRDPAWALIRLAWSSVANLAITPLQDVMRLNGKHRMNMPGSNDGNWRWRLRSFDLAKEGLERLGEFSEMYGRDSNPPAKL